MLSKRDTFSYGRKAFSEKKAKDALKAAKWTAKHMPSLLMDDDKAILAANKN